MHGSRAGDDEELLSPMEEVKGRLRAWSFLHGQDSERRSAHNEAQQDARHQHPPAPPNTEHSSHSPSRRQSRRGDSMSDSPSHTPSSEAETADTPLLPLLAPIPVQASVIVAPDPRSVSTLHLPSHLLHVTPHRDSVELAHRRLDGRSHHPGIGQLAHASDRILLQDCTFTRHPASQLHTKARTGQIRFGCLSPILDASPPDRMSHVAHSSHAGLLHTGRIVGATAHIVSSPHTMHDGDDEEAVRSVSEDDCPLGEL